MKFSIKWLETKGPDWKVATIVNEAGIEYEDVSINRTNKKGEVFPEFDSLLNGGTVQGEYWETPDKTKKYLFPPRVDKPAQRTFGGGQVKAMMKEKQEGIKESMDRKEHSIMESSSMRDAVSLAIAEFESYQDKLRGSGGSGTGGGGSDLEFLIKKWRKFLLDNWSLPF